MNTLVTTVRESLVLGKGVGLRLPYSMGLGVGFASDFVSWVMRKPLAISSIRVRKFCATTQFGTSLDKTGFVRPVSLREGLFRTIRHEFVEDHTEEKAFFTE
jgi:GlcNAc-P-P-Und epimerase